MSCKRPSSDLADFRKKLEASKYVLVLTGAGISAESGIPTLRGPNSKWRNYDIVSLANVDAFNQDPSLVWELYHYRREVVLKSKPNAGHIAITNLQKKLNERNRNLVVATQNIDGLHVDAGAKDVLELHGSLFDVICTKCKAKYGDRASPLSEGLRGKGDPDPAIKESNIQLSDLPRCRMNDCGGLLRPGVVWFGESLDSEVVEKTYDALSKCDMCLVVGTSAVVYPAAGFTEVVANRGVPVAEFNLEETSQTYRLDYHFSGKSGEILPNALNVLIEYNGILDPWSLDPST